MLQMRPCPHAALAKFVPFVMLVTMTAACAQTVLPPEQGLELLIQSPTTDSPFDDPQTKFVGLYAEGVGIAVDALNSGKIYTPAMTLSLSEVPFGKARQIRVMLSGWDAAAGRPTNPIVGRGRTIPTDVVAGNSRKRHAYVTKLNAFAAAVSNDKIESATDGRAGAVMVAGGVEGVYIAGGADPVAGATDPFDPKSWENFKTTIAYYNTDLRTLDAARRAGVEAKLTTGRAFAAGALTDGGDLVVIGGLVDKGNGPEVANLATYLDLKTWTVKSPTTKQPNLSYARAAHTVTRLTGMPGNFFFVAGGKGLPGDDRAEKSWEIWSPSDGYVVEGYLRQRRWNHRAVAIPQRDGWVVLLIGGENADGPLNTLEAIAYDENRNVASPDNAKITCCVVDTCYSAGDVTKICEAKKGEKGYRDVYWRSVTQSLGGDIKTAAARVLPGVVHVYTGEADLLYIIGGFSDVNKTKPLNSIAVLDLSTSTWLANPPTLATARGAPMVTVATVGAQRGKVLVTGGVDADGDTVNTAETISYSPKDQKFTRETSDNTLPGGGMVLGQAVALSTGHILVAGGVSKKGVVMKASKTVRLFNPR